MTTTTTSSSLTGSHYPHEYPRAKQKQPSPAPIDIFLNQRTVLTLVSLLQLLQKHYVQLHLRSIMESSQKGSRTPYFYYRHRTLLICVVTEFSAYYTQGLSSCNTCSPCRQPQHILTKEILLWSRATSHLSGLIRNNNRHQVMTE